MTLFSALKTAVATDLRDPSNVTFSAGTVADLINAALTEVGRIAPERFQEDLTVVAGQLAYPLRSSVFGVPVPEIEVKMVEVWSKATTPHRFLGRLNAASAGYSRSSIDGWMVWGGVLTLTNVIVDWLDPAKHVIRVWGYSPYLKLTTDSQVLTVSNELEQAMRVYCRIEALQRLVFDRDLFSQWQSIAGNTDVTPAGLMNSLSLAQADWRRRERQLFVPREPA